MNALKIVGVSYSLVALILIVSAEDSKNESSHWGSTDNDPKSDAWVSELLAKNMLQLSQEIGTTILQDSDKPTEVFSPLSIYTALSILLMGANGQTFQELMSLLKINNGKCIHFSLFFGFKIIVVWDMCYLFYFHSLFFFYFFKYLDQITLG